MKLKKNLPKILVFSLFPVLVASVLFVSSPSEELFSKIVILASISVILSFVSSLTYSLLSSKGIRGYGGLVGFSGNLLFLLLPVVSSFDFVFLVSVIFDSFFVFFSLARLLDTLIPEEENNKKVKRSRVRSFWEFVFNRQLFFYVSLIIVSLMVFFLTENVLVILIGVMAIFIVLLLEEFVRFYSIWMLDNRSYSGNDRLLALAFSKFSDLLEKLSNTEKFVDALRVELELKKAKQNELKISIGKVLESLKSVKDLLLAKRSEVESMEASLNTTFGDLSTNVLAIEYSISKLTFLSDEIKKKIGDILDVASRGSVKKGEIQDVLSRVLPVFEALLVKIGSARDVIYDIITIEGKIASVISSISDEVGTLLVVATNVEIEAFRSSGAVSLQRITTSITESVMGVRKLVAEVLKLYDELVKFASYLKPVADSIYKHSEKIKITIDFLGSATNSVTDIVSKISQDLINSSTYFDEIGKQISNISRSMSVMRDLLEKISNVLILISEFKEIVDSSVRSIDEIISSVEEIIYGIE